MKKPPMHTYSADWREHFWLEAVELLSDFYLLPAERYSESWKIERAFEASLRQLRGAGWRGSEEDVFHAFWPDHPHHAEACAALATKRGKAIMERLEDALDKFFACYQPKPHWETVLGALDA